MKHLFLKVRPKLVKAGSLVGSDTQVQSAEGDQGGHRDRDGSPGESSLAFPAGS